MSKNHTFVPEHKKITTQKNDVKEIICSNSKRIKMDKDKFNDVFSIKTPIIEATQIIKEGDEYIDIICDIDKVYENIKLYEILIYERWQNKIIILFYISVTEKVPYINTNKKTNTSEPGFKDVVNYVPIIQIWNTEKEKLFEYIFHMKKTQKICSYNFNFEGTKKIHLNNMIFLLSGNLFKINLDNYEIIEKEEEFTFQGMDTQNKTNLLYIGSRHGEIYAFNIKTLNLVKKITFKCYHDDKYNMNSGDIYCLKIIRDKMYIYLYESWDTGIDKILIINDLNDYSDENNNKLYYEAYDLKTWHFTKDIYQYNNLLYFLGEGLHIFDTIKKETIQVVPDICYYGKTFKNYIKVQDKYLIMCIDSNDKYYVKIFDLDKNPLMKYVDYYFKFDNNYIVDVKIIENKIYFYKIDTIKNPEKYCYNLNDNKIYEIYYNFDDLISI